MTVPSVTYNILDGQTGVVSTGASAVAVVGIASSGTVDVPTSVASLSALTAAFGGGPAVELAALILPRSPVLFIRVTQAAAGTQDAIDVTGVTGTSVVTVDGGSITPIDDYDVRLLVTTGGTIGTTGIRFRVSYDAGRNYGPTISLGTATTYVVADAVTFAFAAGTLVAGDLVAIRCNAPTYDSTGLTSALAAYAASSVATELLVVEGAITAALGGVVDTALAGMTTANKPRRWVGSIRMPAAGESDATYQAAAQVISDAYSTTRGGLCAGACKQVSPVSGRSYRRPVLFAYAARQAGLSQEDNAARTALGALTGTQLQDSNGNLEAGYHDEFEQPGLDDMRYITLRTWPSGRSGVYVTRPRLFSADGSDFRLVPHGLVLDVAHRVSYTYLSGRLNEPVLVDATTGRISDAAATEIERACTAVLEAALTSRPKASAVSVAVDRTANIISTSTLPVTIGVVPLGYLEFVTVELSFSNPALVTA